MDRRSLLELHKEMKWRLKRRNGENFVGSIEFSSGNLRVQLTIGTDMEFDAGSPMYEYIADVYGDIGETELDIVVAGTVANTTVAETFIAIDDLENGSFEHEEFCYNWGQLEILLSNREEKELHLVIFMDEKAEDFNNYLIIKIPEYAKSKLMDFLADAYEIMMEVEKN